jgi:SH3-like domain-containing protein
MRNGLLIGTFAGLLSCSAPALAQVFPQEVSVVSSTVEVRSGPSTKFYATSELHQGDRVTVVRVSKDDPAWLEIKPPSGSFSWVNAKSIRAVTSGNGTVAILDTDAGDTIQALVGSATVKDKPNVNTKAGYLRGSIVPVVNPPLNVDGETWVPLQPDSREVRYIPADAIRAGTPVTPTAPPNWALGAKPNTPPATLIPGHPAGGTTDLKPVAGNSTSFSPTPNTSVPVIPGPTTASPQWSSYGILRTTTLTSEGQPIYALVDAKGETKWYVTTRVGTSLRSYLNRTICVFGVPVSRPGEAVSVPYILASHVAIPPSP